jgi:hypothetical protein
LAPDRRAAFFFDGTTVRLPHCEELEAAYPPTANQRGVSHWPLLRLLVAHDLYTGLALRPQWGPVNGGSIGNVFLLPEIMHLNGFGLTLRPPFAAPILVFPDLFLLFRVYGNCRPAALEEFRRFRIDVFKLRIAIRCEEPSLRLAVRLQAGLLFVQPRDGLAC